MADGKVICRLCLQQFPKTIEIFGDDGLQMNVATIVSKHFWFELKNNDPISDKICYKCWWKIENFHDFYVTIEEAQKTLAVPQLDTYVDKFDVDVAAGSDIVKIEQEDEIDYQYSIESQDTEETGQSSGTNTAKLDPEVSNIVKTFDTSKSVIPFIAGRGLTKRSLRMLQSLHIDKLFPASELGLQLEFELELQRWKESEQKAASIVLPTSPIATWIDASELINTSTSHSFSSSRIEEPRNESTSALKPIRDLLCLSLGGRKILENYESKNQINQHEQKLMVRLIVEYYRTFNRRLRSYELELIANDIIKNFPSEDKGTYFLPPQTKQGSIRGMLYNAYYNLNRKFKEKKMRSFRDMQESSRPVVLNNIPANYQELKFFLKFHCKPWEDVLEKWKATAKTRIQEIESFKEKSISQTMMEWPLYRNSAASTLINIDFAAIYPEALNRLFERYDTVKSVLLDEFRCEGAIKNKEYLAMIRRFDSLPENSTPCLLFLALNSVLPPSGMINMKGKHMWKISVKDAEDSFILHCRGQNEVDSMLEVQRKKEFEYHLSSHPTILAVGEDICNLNHYLLHIDGTILKFDDFLKCLDACFKFYIVFNIKYPKASHKVWVFIQTYIYNIQTTLTENSPSVIRFINHLNKTSNMIH